MSFLTFNAHALGASRTTQTWSVLSAASCLGEVRWFSSWRRYCFFPNPGTVFDAACLGEITFFCASETDKQKETWGTK
jgi:hypothetical protein